MSISGRPPQYVTLRPEGSELKILENENLGSDDSDSYFSGNEGLISETVEEPLEERPSRDKVIKEEYLNHLFQGLVKLISSGPAGLTTAELQSLIGLIRESRRAYQDDLDCTELEAWGQLIMD